VALRPPKHPERVAIVVIGLLAVGNLAWFGYRATDTSTAADRRPDAIDVVLPAEDSVVRPQETIGFDLRDGLVGVLSLDRLRIPEDQYDGDRAVGQVFWRPGADKEFEALPGGRHDVTAEYWDASKSEDQAREDNDIFSYTWQFTVG
jgi:hypothetical protein